MVQAEKKEFGLAVILLLVVLCLKERKKKRRKKRERGLNVDILRSIMLAMKPLKFWLLNHPNAAFFGLVGLQIWERKCTVRDRVFRTIQSD